MATEAPETEVVEAPTGDIHIHNTTVVDPESALAAEPAAEANAATQLDEMRRELNAVRQELTDTRQELNTQRSESEAERKRLRDAAINAALDKAIETGRIPPSQRDYFAAQCQKEGGLEEFEAHVATLPQMVGDAGLAHRTPPNTDEVTLTDAEKAYCQAAGTDPEKFLETKKAEMAKGATIYTPSL